MAVRDRFWTPWVAPKARPIIAWGNAPGVSQANRCGSAEGATYLLAANPTCLTTSSLGETGLLRSAMIGRAFGATHGCPGSILDTMGSAEGATYHSLGQRP